jgi:hypothetical protein
MDRIRTQDIWAAAYLLQQGNSLECVEVVCENANLCCYFSLEGEEVIRHELEYLNSNASCKNIIDYRRHYNHLKSLTYHTIKKAKKQLKESAASDKNASTKLSTGRGVL